MYDMLMKLLIKYFIEKKNEKKKKREFDYSILYFFPFLCLLNLFEVY